MDLGNATSTKCQVGDIWWRFLVIKGIIYVFFLLTFSLIFAVYWLVKTKCMPERYKAFKNSNLFMYRERIRDRMRQLISGNTIPGKILITVSLLCNLVYIGLAIYRSYIPGIEVCINIRDPRVIVEMVVDIELMLFALVRFLACDNVALFWLKPHTIVDVFTLPHIFISLFYGVDWIGLRSLRFLWLTMITEVLQYTPLLRSQNAVDILNLMIYFLVLWFTSSGILYLIETQGDFWSDMKHNTHNFLVYVYLTMVTMSTVGYGDISPETASGKAFMILFILGGLAFFAAILPKLVEVTTDLYAKYQYAAFDTTRVPKHVIVCGHVTAVTAEEFLKDFLHPDRGDTRTHVLFLHPEWPDKDLKNVLRTYYTRVQYLLGSVLNGNDLEKAKIHLSSGIFILANKHAENPTEEDHANLLRVVSVKNTTDRIPIIIQLLHSFSKIQVSNIEGWHAGRDIAVCLNELKLGLLAQSCLCPGFSTLVANLFYTSDFPMISSYTTTEEWKRHYFNGAANEVYSTTFSDVFNGMTFHDAAGMCFNKLNLVLFAIENIGSNGHIYYANPSLQQNPDLRIATSSMLGYFIAQDKDHVTKVSTFCDCCDGNKHVAFESKNLNLRRMLSERRRLTSVKRKGSGPQITPTHGGVSKNGDNLIINFNSDNNLQGPISSTSELIEMEPPTITVSNSDEAFGFNKEKALSVDTLDEEDIDDYEKWKIHLDQPVHLDHTILNPHCLSGAKQPDADVDDHIVLCLFADRNSPPLGLHSFLKPLRSKHLLPKSIKPVVIICEKDYIVKEWPVICDIPKLYLVTGSPLLWSNLNAARVTKSSVCVVLTLLHTNSSSSEEAVDDKEPILCSLSIQKKLKKINKRVLVITDISQESNVQFLDFGDEDRPDERIYKSLPFACGEAFSVSMFDSVTSSVYHGPGTLYLVEDLIHSVGTNTLCNLVSLPICDTSFANGSTFGDFFNAQLKEENICLGLSRKLVPDGNQSYVITAPDSKLTLQSSDIAFMLTA